jgi:hypothetical protein
MPKVVASSTDRGGSLNIFCTRSETETIADVTESAGKWLGIFAAAVDPISMTVIRAASVFIPWKARRCLKRNKCLLIGITGLVPTFHEYDPYDSNDGWYQIYSR